MADLKYTLSINASEANEVIKSLQTKITSLSKQKATIDIKSNIDNFKKTFDSMESVKVLKVTLDEANLTKQIQAVNTLLTRNTVFNIKAGLDSGAIQSQFSKVLTQLNNQGANIRTNLIPPDFTVITNKNLLNLKTAIDNSSLDKAIAEASKNVVFKAQLDLSSTKISSAQILNLRTAIDQKALDASIANSSKLFILKATIDDKSIIAETNRISRLIAQNKNTLVIDTKLNIPDYTRITNVRIPPVIVPIDNSGFSNFASVLINRIKSISLPSIKFNVEPLINTNFSSAFSTFNTNGATAGSSFTDGFNRVIQSTLGNLLSNALSNAVSQASQLGKTFANNSIDLQKANTTLATYIRSLDQVNLDAKYGPSNTDTNNALKFADAQRQANGYIAELQLLGAETPYEFPELLETTNTLVGFGYSIKDAIKLTKQIGDVAGGNSQKLKNLGLVIGKVKSQEFVTAGNVNSLVKAGVSIKELAEVTNLTTEEFSKLKSSGKLTSEQVLSAEELKSVLDELTTISKDGSVGLFFQNSINQSKTLGGILSNLSDYANQVFNKFLGVSGGEVQKGSIFAVLQKSALDFQNFIKGDLYPRENESQVDFEKRNQESMLRNGTYAQKFVDGFKNALTTITPIATNVFNGLSSFIGGVLGAIDFSGIFEFIKDFASKINFNIIGGGIIELVKSFQMLSSAISKTPEFQGFKGFAIDVINNIGKGIVVLAKAISDIAKNPDAVKVLVQLGIGLLVFVGIFAVLLPIANLIIGIISVFATLSAIVTGTIVAPFALIAVVIIAIIATLTLIFLYIKTNWEKLIAGIIIIIQVFLSVLGVILLGIVGIVTAVISTIVIAIVAIITTIVAIITAIFTAIIAVVTFVFGLILAIIAGAIGLIVIIVLGIGTVFVNIFNGLLAIASFVWAGVVAIIQVGIAIIEAIIIAIGTAFGFVFFAFVAVVQFVVDSIIAIWNGGVALFNAVVQSISTFFNDVFNGIVVFVGQAIANMVTGFNGLKDGATNIVNTVKDFFVDGFNGIVNSIVDTFTGIGGKITGFFSNIKLPTLKLPFEVPDWAKGILGKQNYAGNPNFQGGITEIAERGRELVKLPNGQLSLYNDRQQTILPKGTVIYNNQDTERILNDGYTKGSNLVNTNNNSSNQSNVDNRNFTRVVTNYSTNYNGYINTNYLTGLN
jgi:hypothetical protein